MLTCPSGISGLRALGCLVSVVAMLGCSACGSSRPKATVEELDHRRRDFAHLNNVEYQSQLETMLRRMEHEVAGPEADPDFDVLIVHGGGAAGGFAAGVLEGWAEVEVPGFSLPEFDLVTGTSSGSLVAPFAFAGGDDDYRRIADLFAHPPQNWGGSSIFALWPTKKAILDVDGLEKQIRASFDSTLVADIVRGAADDRLLMTITTDLDLGLARFWDLGAELEERESEEAVHRLQDLLLAATALPVFLPPREIDGVLHADGAIATSMFLGFDEGGAAWLADSWATRNPDVPMPRIRIWAIINSTIFVNSRTTQPRYPDIAARTVEIALQYDRFKSIRLGLALCRRIDNMPGVVLECRYMVMPDDSVIPADLTDLADEELARDVVEIGRASGRSPASWTTDAPPWTVLPESSP